MPRIWTRDSVFFVGGAHILAGKMRFIARVYIIRQTIHFFHTTSLPVAPGYPSPSLLFCHVLHHSFPTAVNFISAGFMAYCGIGTAATKGSTKCGWFIRETMAGRRIKL